MFSIFISVSFVNFEHILQLFLVFKTSGFSKLLAFKTTGWLQGRLSLYCATHSNDVPTKIVKANADLFSIFVSNAFNESVISCKFLAVLKLADVEPVHKKKTRLEKY